MRTVFSTYQGLYGIDRWFVKQGVMEECGSCELVILLSLEIVCRQVRVHERADCQNHEHQRQSVGVKGVIGRRAGIGVVELCVDFCIKRIRSYWIIPAADMIKSARRYDKQSKNPTYIQAACV